MGKDLLFPNFDPPKKLPTSFHEESTRYLTYCNIQMLDERCHLGPRENHTSPSWVTEFPTRVLVANEVFDNRSLNTETIQKTNNFNEGVTGGK